MQRVWWQAVEVLLSLSQIGRVIDCRDYQPYSYCKFHSIQTLLAFLSRISSHIWDLFTPVAHPTRFLAGDTAIAAARMAVGTFAHFRT